MVWNNKYKPLDGGDGGSETTVPGPSAASSNLAVPGSSDSSNTTKVGTIAIPGSVKGSIRHPSFASRRGSAIRNVPVVASVGKSVDSHVFVNMNNPNFRTSQDRHNEEIINSVRENYLNNNYRKYSNNYGSNTGSVTDSVGSTAVTNSFTNASRSDEALGPTTVSPTGHAEQIEMSALDDPGLSTAGADILRDIYKATKPAEDAQLKRQKSTDDVLLAMERSRRESAAGGLNIPGGFRREFIVNKIRKQSTAGLMEHSSNRTDYGSGSSRSGTPRPSSSVRNPRISIVDTNANTHPTTQEGEVPFLTKNFMEFLYLYGHFAGESFEDDFFEDGENGENNPDGSKQENNPLIPLGSTEAVTLQQVSKVKGTASSTKVFLLLMKSFVGPGVLFLPQGFHNGGLTLSIFLLILFGCYSYWCYYILIQSKVYTKVSSFGDIGLRTYGKWMKFAILLSLVLTQVGFSAAYVIFVAKNLQAFIRNVFNFENVSLSLLMIFQLLVFIPLSFIRNISKLSLPSLFANFFILIGLVIVLFYTIKHLFVTLDMKPAEGVIFGVNSNRWTLFVGTAIFTFEGIGLIIPVQDSMKYPERFPLILGMVIMTATILFVIVATLGYLSYGDKVETVILLNLPQNSIIVNLIQLFYSLAIMLSTPLQLFPAIKIIENRVFASLGKLITGRSAAAYREQGYQTSGKSNPKIKWLKNLGRAVIVSIVVLVAYCGFDSLDKFVSIIGSICCLPLVYIFPAMLHLKCLQMSQEAGTITRAGIFLILFDKILIVFGVISMVYTSYQSIFS